MSRTRLLAALLLVSTLESNAAPLELTGVSLAGADFGDGSLPGTYGSDYTYPNQGEVDYFAGKDMNVVRLPFRWERLQRSLNSPFDSGELALLDGFVTATTAKGVSVILDPHNYARYFGNIVGSTQVPYSAFADFWTRLASLYKDNPRVIFGLMNEPNTMATETWLAAANAAIAAIRATGATNLILVPGNAWTGAHSWLENWYGTPNGTAMLGVVDSGNNFAFEMHQYLDSNSSGGGNDTVSATIGSERLAAATQWLRENGYRGFLGEFAGYTDATALAALDDMLDYMEANSDAWMGWTYWAAGPWWGDYRFTLEPDASGDRPQMASVFPHTQVQLPQPMLDPAGSVEFATRTGYYYRVSTSETLDGWTTGPTEIAGDGGAKTVPVPEVVGKDRYFLRLNVSKTSGQ